jgi:hypothetical protein
MLYHFNSHFQSGFKAEQENTDLENLSIWHICDSLTHFHKVFFSKIVFSDHGLYTLYFEETN